MCNKTNTELTFSYPNLAFLLRLSLLFVILLLFSMPIKAATDCAAPAQTDIPQIECAALVAFYNSTDGPNWTNSPANDWNVTNLPCSWMGVICGGGQVTHLYLSNNNLTGIIPNSINDLAQLQFLYLDNNQLSGSIPDLSALIQLVELTLHNNQLSGPIPDLSNLTNLDKLYLEKNQLAEDIPPSLTGLTSLTELDLGYNKFTIDTNETALISFLNTKDADWANTQTVAPTITGTKAISSTEIQINWNPILYTGDGGYYQVTCGTIDGISMTPQTTSDKTVNNLIITGLLPNTTYNCVVETFTPAHPEQQNDLLNDLSMGVTATTIEPPPPPPPSYRLTVKKVGDGTVKGNRIDCGSDCREYYVSGTNVTLTAISADDFRFGGWSGDCDVSGKVQITSKKSCTATFDKLLAGYASTPEPKTRLDFGRITVGEVVNKEIIVQETGEIALEVDSANLIDKKNFSIVSGKPPFVIPKGGEAHTLIVQCHPQIVGIRHTSLFLKTNDPSQLSVRYPFTCEGVDIAYDSKPSPGGTLNLSSVVGEPSTVVLTILERGNDTLVVSEATLTGEHVSDFSIKAGKPPLTIPDGGSPQTLQVQCVPSMVGERKATLTLTTNDPKQASVTYPLICTGIKPLIPAYASEPVPGTTLQWSSKVGQPSVVALKVSEMGENTLEVSESRFSDEHASDFSIAAGKPPLTIQEGGSSQTLQVQCVPSVAGEHKATLTLTTNDPKQASVTYPLICNGIKPLIPAYASEPVQGTTLQWSSKVGQPSITALKVLEAGENTLEVTNSHLSGEHASDFSIKKGMPPFAISNGSPAHTLLVQCLPSVSGTRTATLSLTTNDPALPKVSYSLKCTGLGTPGYSSTPAPQNTVPIGSSYLKKLITSQLTIQETGTTTLIISNSSLSGTHASDFYLNKDVLPLSIVDGDKAHNITIKCVPSEVGERIATLELTTNDPQQPSVSYPLTCEGKNDRVEVKNPTDIILSNNILPENSVINTEIGWLSTVDPDGEEGDTYHYTLANNADGQHFKIVGNQLQVATELDKYHYTITITTTDKMGGKFTKAFTLLKNNVTPKNNAAPIDILLFGNTVDKNSIVDAWLGALSTIDPDKNDKHRYILNNDADGRFKIVGGELQIADDSVGFDSSGDYLITITTTDQGGLSFSKDLTLQVCDEKHAIYQDEDKRLHIPLLDIWLYEPITQQPLKEVGVFKGDLMFLEGYKDFKVISDSVEFLYTLPKPSACHALYQNGQLYIPYVDVAMAIISPNMISPITHVQTFGTILKQLSTDLTLFHLDSYILRQ
jgi:hypothetical protein